MMQHGKRESIIFHREKLKLQVLSYGICAPGGGGGRGENQGAASSRAHKCSFKFLPSYSFFKKFVKYNPIYYINPFASPSPLLLAVIAWKIEKQGKI